MAKMEASRQQWLRRGRGLALVAGIVLGLIAAASLSAAFGVSARGWSDPPLVPDAAVWIGLMAGLLSLLGFAISYRLHRDARDAERAG